MKKLILFSFPTFFMAIFCYGQNPYWKPGGNTNVGLDAVTLANNSLGTVAGNNIPLNIITNGIQRMRIMQGGIGANAGRIGFGNNLPANFVPLSRFQLHQTNGVNTIRFTTDNMLNGVGFEIGYDASSAINNQRYAEIHNRENTPIKFFTTGNTQRMHINQSRQSAIGLTGLKYNVPVSGYVGIGRNTGNIWGTNTGIGRGPYSLLHLNNDVGSPEQAGYRPWMRGGISFTNQTDFS